MTDLQCLQTCVAAMSEPELSCWKMIMTISSGSCPKVSTISSVVVATSCWLSVWVGNVVARSCFFSRESAAIPCVVTFRRDDLPPRSQATGLETVVERSVQLTRSPSMVALLTSPFFILYENKTVGSYPSSPEFLDLDPWNNRNRPEKEKKSRNKCHR